MSPHPSVVRVSGSRLELAGLEQKETRMIGKLGFASLAVVVLTAACATSEGTGVLAGGAGGGVIGGGIGALAGGTKGAMIGAALGGVVGGTSGALVGRYMDKQK